MALHIIHYSLHAYRKGHNTTTALISMYDKWAESVDMGLVSAAIVLDMSAAFDILDRNLLLKKLQLLGFQDSVLGWFDSYLSNRFQSVCINGVLSKLRRTNSGVPQGSILGPVLYTLFTLEVPELIYEQEESSLKWPPYHTGDGQFGNIVVYADDTTINLAAKNSQELTSLLENKFQQISEYMVNQGLKLNDDKSHLLVFVHDSEVTLKTPLGEIKPSECERILGGLVQKDLKWNSHIHHDRNSLVSTLNKRCSALKLISKVASFKTRKTVANGLFMGKLSYLICVWGGTTKKNFNALQVLQNRVLRFVTRNWEASTADNLKTVGWLSVHQLAVYHTVLLMFQIKESRMVGQQVAPQYLIDIFDWEYGYRTRQAEKEKIKPKGIPTLEVTRSSFRHRAAKLFNLLPEDIAKAPSLQSFKASVKVWIKENIRLRA